MCVTLSHVTYVLRRTTIKLVGAAHPGRPQIWLPKCVSQVGRPVSGPYNAALSIFLT